MDELDLIVSSVTLPSLATLGESVDVSWTVSNLSEGLVSLNDWYDSIYISDDELVDSNDINISSLYAGSYPALLAGSNYVVSTSIFIPTNITAGDRYLLVETDDYNSQSESNEDNNVIAQAITLTAPDLVVSEATAPTSASVGETISVSWTVTNQGEVATNSDYWYDYIYFSNDEILDSSDIYITNEYISRETALAAGESYTISRDITIGIGSGYGYGSSSSDDFGSGTGGYLLFVTDRENWQGETDETNNLQAVPLAINAPDLVVSAATTPASAAVGETISVSWTVSNEGTVAAVADWYDTIYISDDEFYDGSDTFVSDRWAGEDTPLAAGASYTATQNIFLPNTAIGDRYLLFVTDSYSYQAETNGTNNVRAVEIELTAPDLIVSAATAPALAAVGETISVSWTVTNQGNEVAGSDWFDYVYLSSDATFDFSDTFVASEFISTQTPLAADGSYTITRDITLPNTITGSPYLLFVADGNSSQGETDETNNVRAVQLDLAAPDLVVSDVTAPASAILGENISISWTVTNQSSAIAPRDWSDYIYISNDATFDFSDTFVTSEFISTQTPLAADGSYTITRNISIPVTATGDRYLLIVADNNNNQGETDETNNVRAVAINLSAPDLVVSNISAPVEALSGQQIEVAWTITNQGNADATGSWTDYVYLSDDDTIGGDRFIDDFSFTGTIAAGASIERRQFITVPIDISGNFRIVVAADIFGNLSEGTDNESNNISIDDNPIAVQLSPFPNLQVSSVTAPATAFSSQQAVIEWTVTNTGTGATSAPFWYDNVWLSLDNSFDNSDTFLGSVTNASYLNVGESYTNSLTVNLPRGIDGNYYFLVQTDTSNNVFEFQNENDNFGVGDPTDIELTPPPDLQVSAVNAPTQAFSGQPLTLSWTVTNEGTGRNLEVNWYDDIFISVDEVLDADDIFVGRSFQNRILNAGESYNATQTVNLPIGVSGDFFFFVRTDAGNQVFENVFEANNIGYDTTATNINLTPPPDLEVELVDAPSEASASRPLTINYRVTNFGATATPNFSWTDTFYLSADTELDPETDLTLGSQTHFGALDIGVSYDNAVTFTLPNTISGDYYAFVVTDSNNNVFELNNDNNIVFGSTAINISSRPADLVVSATAPTTAEAGKAIAVEWTVTNQGIGDTAVTNWNDQIVASADAVLGNGDDVVLATFAHNGLLNPGDSYTSREFVTIPFNLVGEYSLFVVADTNNRVYEATNENNNFSIQSLSVTRQTPDLQVTAVSIPATAVSGQALTVNWTVQNLGAGRTNTDYWYDDVYLSADAVLSNDDRFLGRVYRSGVLEPSGEYTVSRAFDLPLDLEGEFYTLVSTDSTERVLESPLENNNNLASAGVTSISLSPVPDLVVANVDAASTAISGQLLNVTWTVSNNGDASTGDRTWFDTFYLSRDQFFDRNSDTYIGFKAQTQNLAAGASYTDTASFSLPLGLSGPFYVFAVTDNGNSINERNGEQNNIGYDGNSTQINLAQPADLLVSSIIVPASGIPGQNATISYTVINQGANPALGTWFDSIYISADNQWDVGDTLFGRVQHFGDVASGDSYSETLTAALPGVIPGDYYVIIRSDIRNQIPESNDSNNTQASSTQVSLDAEELQLDIADIDTLAQGQSIFYRVDVPAGESLVITFDSDSTTAFNEVYVSFAEVPTRADFDFAAIAPFSPDQRVVVPTTQAGTYFIRAFGNNVSSEPAGYSITAEIAEFSVFDTNYGRGGNVGNLTIEINGVKFDRTVTARLTDGAGINRQAVQIYPIDSTKAFATFDLRGLAPGNYDVIIANADGESIIVSDGLEVVAGGGGNNRPTIDAPGSVRRESSFSFTTSWSNDGLNDAVVPLLQVGNDSVPFGLRPGDLSAGTQTTFLGTVDEGPAGILRPGQSVSVPFFSISRNTAGTYQVSVDRQFNNLDAPFDFNAIRNSLIPAGVTEAEFQPIFQQFIAQIGSTQGDYVEALARNATLLPPELGDNRSEDDLLELELRKAIAAVGTSISGNVFARSFEVDLSGIEVRANNTTTGKTFTTITLNDGSFIFEDLTSGSYTLAVPSALIQGDLPPVELTAGEAVTGLTINLRPGAKISGEITAAASGESLVDAGVYLFSNGELIDTVLANAQGEYVFNALPAGTYTILVESPQLARTWVSDVVVAEDEVLIDVSLIDDASVTGTVSLADNQPAQNFVVIASLEGDNPFPIFTEVSETGNFSLDSLATGVYDITVYQTGYVPVTFDNVNIAAGANLNLGAIELEVDNSTAPVEENSLSTFAVASADAALISPLSIGDLFVPNELRLLKAAAQVGVYGIILRYGLGAEATDIANRYFNSLFGNSEVTISPTGFTQNDSPVTKSALEYIVNAYAGAIYEQIDKLPQVKNALENFDCEQGDQRIPLGDAEQLRQLLGLENALLFVDDNSPVDAKDRWKYSGVSNIPGFLAGGVGLGGPPPFIPPVPTILDTRRVSGNLTLNISRSGAVTLEADFNVEITDTFDFNPGGLGTFEDGDRSFSAIVVAGGVIGLGVLETFSQAFDVPFRTSFQEQLKVPTLLDVPSSDDCCDDDCENDDEDDINVPASFDPNDILGPQGFGEERWVAATSPLAYTIRFENDPVFATAPAQTVRITQQLDSDLDFRSFRVGDFGFGEIFIDVPDNQAFYQSRLDLTATLGIEVDVVAGIDVATGEAFWEFTSIDPATGEIPADPLRGFLPPNLTPPEGDGFVNYTIRPKSNVTTGTVIDAQARIVFDINEPIDTPPIFNTIDTGRPTSTVDVLPATSETEEFLVNWSGSDDPNGSALANFTIYVSENGSPFTPWLEDTTLTEATYTGQPGRTYAFYSVARDNAGNIEAAPTTADTQITIAGNVILSTLAFDAIEYSINEDGTLTAAITINRTVNTVGTLSATVILADGTTTSPGDYDNTPIVVNFADGESSATVTITIVDDAIAEGNETFNLNLEANSSYDLGDISTTTITIVDNDTAGVIISESDDSTNVAEGGASDTYTVVLASQPTADVAIAINADPQISTNVNSLTFTAANWNVAQTITVAAVDDNTIEGNHASTVTLSATSADINYDGIAIASVNVSITDNDQEILGTSGRNTLTGGSGSDIITGLRGADVLTGGDGSDQFVYTNIRDAGDLLTDFVAGTDKIVLTELFQSLSLGSLNYESATAQGYLSFANAGSNTAILIDVDGTTGRARPTPLLTVQNQLSSTLAQSDNFLF